MSKFGVYLLIFGVGSMILNLMDMEFRLLMWIDTWGPGPGLAIRCSMIVLGLGLVFAGRSKAAPAE